MNKKSCEHLKYCQTRMRDGDQAGCFNRQQRFGCWPTVARPVHSEIHLLLFKKNDRSQ